MLSRHLINLSIHVTKHKERAKSCHALKLKVMQMISDTKHLFNLIYKLLRVSKVTKRLTAALCLALVDDHHSRLWRASHWQHISCRIQGQEAPCSDQISPPSLRPGTRSLVMFRITYSVSSSTQRQQRAAFSHEVSANIIFFADNITVALQHCYHSSPILPTFHSQMKRYNNESK